MFLEAVQVIDGLSNIDLFSVWIIGGDDDETRVVYNMISCIPSLHTLMQQGRVMLWGRVENDSLPELISRSSVVVMPSYREQFGMVAVEAMLCGCPVIAADVGGLKDVILNKKTGFLFRKGDSLSLASVLSGFLRNKPHQYSLRSSAQKWAMNFNQVKTFEAIKSIYTNDHFKVKDFWADGNDGSQLIVPKNALEVLLNKKLKSYQVIHSHGKHHSVLVKTASKTYFAKKVNEAPSCQASVFPIDFARYPNPKSSLERYLRETSTSHKKMSPRIIAKDRNERLIVYEPHKEATVDCRKDIQVLKDILKKIKVLSVLDDKECFEYKIALETVIKSPTIDTIRDFDWMASHLNQRILIDYPCFTRINCHVELHRLKILLEENTWCMPVKCAMKFNEVINCLLNTVKVNTTPPVLIHGDLKTGHFLHSNTGIILCDWEHSKFCAGYFDEALIAFKLFIRIQRPSISDALAYLRLLLDKEGFDQATCWLIAQIIFASIFWSSQGNADAFDSGYDTLKDFSIIWYSQNH